MKHELERIFNQIEALQKEVVTIRKLITLIHKPQLDKLIADRQAQGTDGLQAMPARGL